MAERQPYRLLKDTVYHRAGTVVQLLPGEVDDALHQHVDARVMTLEERIDAAMGILESRIAALEDDMKGLMTPAAPPPSLLPQ